MNSTPSDGGWPGFFEKKIDFFLFYKPQPISVFFTLEKFHALNEVRSQTSCVLNRFSTYRLQVIVKNQEKKLEFKARSAILQKIYKIFIEIYRFYTLFYTNSILLTVKNTLKLEKLQKFYKFFIIFILSRNQKVESIQKKYKNSVKFNFLQKFYNLFYNLFYSNSIVELLKRF